MLITFIIPSGVLPILGPGISSAKIFSVSRYQVKIIVFKPEELAVDVMSIIVPIWAW